jgi:hypothetical protein
LDEQRQVAPDMAMAFCEAHNLPYCENSSKANFNVDATFDMMLKLCVENQANQVEIPGNHDKLAANLKESNPKKFTCC